MEEIQSGETSGLAGGGSKKDLVYTLALRNVL